MNKSIEEKRALVNSLALKLGYNTDNTEFSKTENDFIWGLIDCGYRNDKILDGECSLQETIDFDLKKWEKEIDIDIETLETIIKRQK